MVAIIIASFPPNSRKVRKIIESEKLKINLERGKARLIRGAIRAAHRKNTKNCHEKTLSNFKLNNAKIKQMPPTIPIEIL